MKTTAFLSGNHHAGTNLVLLDPDVCNAFPSERAVNDAFDLVIESRKVGSYKQALRGPALLIPRPLGAVGEKTDTYNGLRRKGERG